MAFKNISTRSELKIAVEQLELRQAEDWPLLKNEFLSTCEKLKPLNILKNTFKEFTSSTDFKDDMLGAAMGVTAGLISKALIVGVSKNPIKNILGSLVQSGISNIVLRNTENIKSTSANIINFFTKQKNTGDHEKKSI
jgi:hypothetical protein